MDTVGKRIRAARKAAGMTQAELQNKIGVSYDYISKYENGFRKPKYETLKKIADALSVPVTSLLAGSKQLTNADRIRAMSDEELAGLLLHGCVGGDCGKAPMNEHGSINCFLCRMKWLKKPAEEVHHE